MKSLNNSAWPPPPPLSMPRDPSIARATKTPQAAGTHNHDIPVSPGLRRYPRRQVHIGHARGFNSLQEEEGRASRRRRPGPASFYAIFELLSSAIAGSYVDRAPDQQDTIARHMISGHDQNAGNIDR